MARLNPALLSVLLCLLFGGACTELPEGSRSELDGTSDNSFADQGGAGGDAADLDAEPGDGGDGGDRGDADRANDGGGNSDGDANGGDAGGVDSGGVDSGGVDSGGSGLCQGSYLLCDDLSDGETRGQAEGGSFVAAGWQRGDGVNQDKLSYELCGAITEGEVEFGVKGLKPSGQLAGGGQNKKAYFFGLYNNQHGDKTQSAVYYEFRYNGIDYDGESNFENKIKFDHGNWPINPTEHNRERYEPQTAPYNWDPDHTYHFKLKFEPRKAWMYIDDELEITAGIKNTDAAPMKYLYLGDINYGGEDSAYTGPEKIVITFVKVTGNASCESQDD